MLAKVGSIGHEAGRDAEALACGEDFLGVGEGIGEKGFVALDADKANVVSAFYKTRIVAGFKLV